AIAAMTLGLALFGCKGPTNNDNGPIFYTVSFDLDGGLPEQGEQKVAAGAKATKPADDPEKDGFYFLGWFSGDEEAAYDFNNRTISSNLALKAKWSEVPVFYVIFDPDDGEPVPNALPVREGGFATKPANDPEKTGWIFLYWHEEDEDDPFDFESTLIVGEITLKAKWEEANVVSFNYGYDDKVERKTVRTGDKVTEPQGLTRNGYVFIDWYTEAALTTKFDFDAEITQSITLYAKWAFVLTENLWTDGEITATARELWYAFDVEQGKTYRVWVNDTDVSGGGKTVDAIASAWYADGREIFIGADRDPPALAPGSNDTVYVKIHPLFSGSTGTFAVVYGTGSARPAIPVDLSFDDAIALTENQWTDGEITATAGELWYAFDVEQGKTYRVWWNDRNQGDGSKSLYVAVAAWYEDGGEIAFGRTYGFNRPITFTPTSDDVVYVRVRGSSAFSTGTFGIVYSASNTRPAIPLDLPFDDAISLMENQWTDGEITATARELWYAFDVEQGKTYRIWWNDGYQGDRSKSLRGAVDAWHGDGGEIAIGQTYGFNSPITFTPTSSGAVYVRARGQYASETGTFGIVYSASNTRPAIPVDLPFDDAIALTENQWTDGEITAAATELWYSFPVVAGATYRIWVNDTDVSGGGKTVDAIASAWYADGREIFIGADGDPPALTPGSDDTVYVKIHPRSSGRTGTFAVVYSTGNVRPAITQ
ncbi:MAG: InlB B-repeat-containing protein, partial [Treponema sp.]|nr:InlB B-repeat-containing protein [Treponema sp.]